MDGGAQGIGDGARRALSVAERQIAAEVLRLYSAGWFPMAESASGEVEWVQPDRRGLLPLDERFHVSRSLRKVLRRPPGAGGFEVRCDTAFGEVIRACAEPRPGRTETWLSPEIVSIFEILHAAGLAHSVETWLVEGGRETLVGGVYGLAVGRIFAGESMFSRPELGGTDASKVALVHLVHHTRRQGFSLFDAQMTNPHLVQFGIYEIPAEEYQCHAARLAWQQVEWGAFDPSRTREELA